MHRRGSRCRRSLPRWRSAASRCPSGSSPRGSRRCSWTPRRATSRSAGSSAGPPACPTRSSLPGRWWWGCWSWGGGRGCGGGVVWVVFLLGGGGRVCGGALKASGAGEPAAIASGLRVDAYKIAVYGLAGAISAFAGLLFAVKLAGGAPNIAEGFLLPAIVAVLIGGTPLTGGVGGVLNTLIGALIVAVIRTAMVYLDVPATAQQIVFGLVLIVAIALTIDRSKLAMVK